MQLLQGAFDDQRVRCPVNRPFVKDATSLLPLFGPTLNGPKKDAVVLGKQRLQELDAGFDLGLRGGAIHRPSPYVLVTVFSSTSFSTSAHRTRRLLPSFTYGSSPASIMA